ncbi:MAG: hypothetical protein JSU98_13160 [Gemmatimonadales bacterium]|jgi:hypothetical protein|nr:MAG: hypothetical protein JSU98_13160 [Gemmatimonadales bacterium]
MTDRNKRLLMKAMQNESTWLQKALFALAKAEDARTTLAELSDEKVEELRAPAKGKYAPLSAFRDTLEGRVSALMEDLQEQRRVVNK